MSAQSKLPGSIAHRDWRLAPPLASDALTWLGILLAYGLLFTLLRVSAQFWAAHELFSLWFPAAGLRFALLWWAGPRMAPLVALSEFVVSLGTGTVELGPSPVLGFLGIVGPCLVYGLVIHGVQSRQPTRPVLPRTDLMPFAIAALLCPVFACLAALPWAIPLALEDGYLSGQVLFSSLLVFTLGDMLGILVLAPPIFWLLQKQPSGSPVLAFRGRALEACAVLLVSFALVLLIRWLDYGLQLAPLVLAAGWIGLRAGRLAAWVAVLLISLISLSLTMAPETDVERVTDHMLLLLIIAAGYLAGTYADAQALAAAEISRRDRLLYHAERLKTLRAMSVAVIHELSQPLSTISLEANGLLATTSRSNCDFDEVREMAEIIARKSSDLAQLITRLRQFGERGDETLSLVSASVIFNAAVQVAGGEMRSLEVALESSPGPNAGVHGSEIELRQAFLNLLRNGIAAASSSNRLIRAGWTVKDAQVTFFVENGVNWSKQTPQGMGIGLIIAKAIARAHGGSIGFSQAEPGKVATTLVLPITAP